MSGINTRNVHRSNFLMGHPYGKDFIYDEMIMGRPGETREELSRALAHERAALANGPRPGDGPPKHERDAGFYDVLFLGTAPGGRQVRISVGDNKDPGYGSTSKIVTETAICLLEHPRHIPGGIWTPGAALQKELFDRMTQRAGLKFKVEG
jgi:short subunit dehydrogenase-like uncharacterized protein